MDRDLHDDCLRIARRYDAALSDGEKRHLAYVASCLACGDYTTLEDRRLARSIIWSFHGQGPGRSAPLA